MSEKKLVPLEGNKGSINSSQEKEQFCSYIAVYKLNMFRAAKSILHNDADAEDATSEAILKAYSNLNCLQSFASFKPWIMKIVINEAYALYNRRKRMMCLAEVEVSSEESRENDGGELWRVVKTLDEEFRAVTILFYYEDLSIKEISKILDVPAGTVKSRLARARQKLKELLVDKGSD